MSDHFKIYCAVYVFLEQNNQIFLMRRANTGYRDGYWGVPGGHVEMGESLLQAICREAFEETDLTLKPENLKLRHASLRRSDRVIADYFFTCEKWDGAPTIHEPTKCDAAKWFDCEVLPEKIPQETLNAWQCIVSGEPFSDIETAGREV